MLSVKTESATKLPFDENPLRAISRGKQRRLLQHQHAANTAALPRVLLPPQIAMARTPSRQRLPTRPSPVRGPSPVRPARPDPATDSKTSRRRALPTRDSFDSGRSSPQGSQPDATPVQFNNIGPAAAPPTSALGGQSTVKVSSFLQMSRLPASLIKQRPLADPTQQAIGGIFSGGAETFAVAAREEPSDDRGVTGRSYSPTAGPLLSRAWQDAGTRPPPLAPSEPCEPPTYDASPTRPSGFSPERRLERPREVARLPQPLLESV